jgi:hypothetical protein
VAALSNAVGDAPQRQPHRGQPEKHDLNAVARRLPFPHALRVSQPAQGALKGEIRARRSQPVEFAQEQPPGGECCQFRF